MSKEALVEAGWGGLAVDDNNLTVQIAALRRVLAEAAGAESWIETLPRRGYRYVGPGGRSAVTRSGQRKCARPLARCPKSHLSRCCRSRT